MAWKRHISVNVEDGVAHYLGVIQSDFPGEWGLSRWVGYEQLV